jgi:phospholipase/carboxylesterase
MVTTLISELIPAREAGSGQLMVALHGLGDSLEGFRWLPQALGIPTMNYLLVNAPDPYYGGFSWYDIYGDAAPGIARSRKELAALFDGLPARGFPTALTTVLGFSQGCLMTIETAARYPGRFAGLVGISGYAHDPETMARELSPAAREQRLLLTHGTMDQVVPCPPVEKQVALLRKAGLQIEWKVYAKAHEIAGGEEIGLIRRFVEAGYAAGGTEKGAG